MFLANFFSFRQAKVFANEMVIEGADFEDLGDNISIESLDKTYVKTIKERKERKKN